MDATHFGESMDIPMVDLRTGGGTNPTRCLAGICGAKASHNTLYHLQRHEKIERQHRTLKDAIKAHNNIKWTESLPTVLLGVRAAIRPDSNHSIAQMVYGTNIKFPEFFEPLPLKWTKKPLSQSCRNLWRI
ncbi:retrovirus-related Pol polyprotein from transposon opus [Trichonephila clavipes]|nr:retrovirus-related Pol polyprotein from transposon opus [Trichonephila clavipes]